MDIERKIEELKHTVGTTGWKIAKEQFEQQKETLKNLMMEIDFTKRDSIGDAIGYQAEYRAIERFPEVIKDMISNLSEKLEASDA